MAPNAARLTLPVVTEGRQSSLAAEQPTRRLAPDLVLTDFDKTSTVHSTNTVSSPSVETSPRPLLRSKAKAPNNTVQKIVTKVHVHGCTLRSDAQYYWCQRGEETVDNVLDEPLHTATVNNRHNILFSIRTTKRYHSVRMGLLLNTWMSRLNATNFFIVTDDSDPQLEEKAKSRGMYANVGNIDFVFEMV